VQRADVDIQQRQFFPQVGLHKRTADPAPRIVDKQVDGAVCQRGQQTAAFPRVGQVGAEHLAPGGQGGSQRPQALGAAGYLIKQDVGGVASALRAVMAGRSVLTLVVEAMGEVMDVRLCMTLSAAAALAVCWGTVWRARKDVRALFVSRGGSSS